MALKGTRSDILGVLLRKSGQGGLRLKDITGELGLAHPTVLRHLELLLKEGLVESRREGPGARGARYWAKPTFQALWVDPGTGRIEAWNSHVPMDWRFPLVARVKDGKAQEFLFRWLDALLGRDLLPKSASRFESAPKAAPLVQLVVYGSAVRGETRPGSDIDVLVYTDLAKKRASAIIDVAHETYFGTGRTPDVRVMDAKTWAAASAAFRASIRSDGRTVFSSDPSAPFLEDTVEAQQ